jgi:transposase
MCVHPHGQLPDTASARLNTTARHLVSWAGLCPRLDESAGKARSRRVRKGTCPFRLTHPGVRRTGCGRLSSALGPDSERHPAWTHVFRVEVQTQGGGRPRQPE